MSNELSLYERLGEREAIAAVVDRFYERVLADDRLAEFFDDADVAALRRHQTQFLCAATGGPAQYDGDDMQTAHDSLDVTDDAFDIVAMHLDAALREFDVDAEPRSNVLEAVESYRGDVVTA